MSRLRTLRTALLVADAAAHVVAFRQAQRADASSRDRFGMLGGAAMYALLAAGVAGGNSVAEREAARAPVGGIAALVVTWKQSAIPAATRQAIIGIDVLLVVAGIAARRESAAIA
ncbi:MAG: hypothetical protein JJE46_12235 [Acidimicrobiia bacterium]|nr:hypothetical protein [Acidimicrobiia bacterium]